MYAGERELHARDFSLTIDIISYIPTVGMCENEFGTWCLNFTTIQWLTSLGSYFTGTCLSVCGERKGFEKRERKNKFKSKREHINSSHI